MSFMQSVLCMLARTLRGSTICLQACACSTNHYLNLTPQVAEALSATPYLRREAYKDPNILFGYQFEMGIRGIEFSECELPFRSGINATQTVVEPLKRIDSLRYSELSLASG